MKAKHWIFISIIGIWLLYHLFRLNHIVFAVTMSSMANEPTLEQNSIHFCSKYAKPSLFRFMAFRNERLPGQPLWIYRICGMPGDKVEIKKGVLFVNDIDADNQLTLSHPYIIRIMDTLQMNIPEYSTVRFNNTDSLVVSVADQLVIENHTPVRRYILPADFSDSLISRKYKQPWNQDNFGPIIVPKDAYFLLGDNRSDAMDSRYIGCLYSKDIVGCLLY